MKFHERLYGLRKAAGMTQADLAEKLNVSRQAVSRWEMGTAMPDVENLIALSDLFGVSLDYLLRGHTESIGEEPAEPLPPVPHYWDYVPKLWWLPVVIGVLLKVAYYVYFLFLWLRPFTTNGVTASTDESQNPFLLILFSVPMWNVYANICFAVSALCFLWALAKWLKARK